MEPWQYLVYLVPIAVIGGYYAWWTRKVKAAGGLGAIHERVQRDKFGLSPGEAVVPGAQWRGMFYIGPLVPETQRSTGEQVVDLLTNTSWRGQMVEIAITTGGRLVVSAEPPQDGGPKRDASLGDLGYRPLAAFQHHERPRLVSAHEAFGAHGALQKELANAPSYNGYGSSTVSRWELCVLQPSGQPSGRAPRVPMVLWLEPAGRAGVQSFCA